MICCAPNIPPRHTLVRSLRQKERVVSLIFYVYFSAKIVLNKFLFFPAKKIRFICQVTYPLHFCNTDTGTWNDGINYIGRMSQGRRILLLSVDDTYLQTLAKSTANPITDKRKSTLPDHVSRSSPLRPNCCGLRLFTTFAADVIARLTPSLLPSRSPPLSTPEGGN